MRPPRKERDFRDQFDRRAIRQSRMTTGADHDHDKWVAMNRRKQCTYCRRTGHRKLTLDHVQPLSRGGDHSYDNSAWVCARCNSAKRDMFLLEWVWSGGYARHMRRVRSEEQRAA